ncbi:D-glycero-beta-D-manno-heptose 1-phosphate adenylyltransferase [uncultured Desulfovibrio sp.]|uniref:Bifunctional protein HldE n=1 Tax=Candidatus Desulfovibrio intestinavium TaxID=2838534 RepID=A0A9D2HMF8_9BACT|nr:D-glycero-beta-D-manno-heptose 1-phosphate adenylyltransferase [uncultured Desulfovibrio sp.]HJA79406.1 D-glycero-beta-D-manno-heptose 1-phosphate adenylyltransferase [Candidatus Desulfovibrio intestinavium]
MDFSSLDIVVAGDVMLDRYISAAVERISPEAPIPVARVGSRWEVPGGAANVARNLARLGVRTRLAGLCGEDEAAASLRRLLDAEGIRHELVPVPGRPTTCKTRVMAQGQQLLRLDEEVRTAPDAPAAERLRQAAEDLLDGCDVLVLSDYGKGTLLDGAGHAAADGLCRRLIRAARERGLPVLVDPKGKDWDRYAGAHCLTPNAAELVEVAGPLPGAREALGALACSQCRRWGVERLLLTRGAKGMALFAEGAEPCFIRAETREVADVSGAGDTALAVLAAGIGAGMGWEEAARLANTAAGVAVGKLGTAPISLEELRMALRQYDANPRLFSLPTLREKVEDWRRKGERIVFTNGCFDLIHPGHISLVQQCADLGNRLVVALNSDASVRRLKGPSRPVQDEQSRALIMAQIKGVDAVILFDEDTPLELIRALRPDVLVKGSDYNLQTVVGAEEVLAYGGTVHLASLVDGCSTSGLVRRMGGPDKARGPHEPTKSRAGCNEGGTCR